MRGDEARVGADAPFDAVVADDVEAVDGGGVFRGHSAVGNRRPIHYVFEGGFTAGEEAADYPDTVVFLQFQFAGGGDFVVGGEGGYGLLEELELPLGDGGVGGAGAGALAVAPGKVADTGEERADVGQSGAEEDYAVDEGTLPDDDLFADGAGYLLAGVEELEWGVVRGTWCVMRGTWGVGRGGEELDAAAYLREADTGTKRHGIPAGRVVEENFSYLGKIFVGRWTLDVGRVFGRLADAWAVLPYYYQ